MRIGFSAASVLSTLVRYAPFLVAATWLVLVAHGVHPVWGDDSGGPGGPN